MDFPMRMSAPLADSTTLQTTQQQQHVQRSELSLEQQKTFSTTNNGVQQQRFNWNYGNGNSRGDGQQFGQVHMGGAGEAGDNGAYGSGGLGSRPDFAMGSRGAPGSGGPAQGGAGRAGGAMVGPGVEATGGIAESGWTGTGSRELDSGRSGISRGGGGGSGLDLLRQPEARADTWVGVSSRPTATTAYTEVSWPLKDEPLCAAFVGPEERSTLLNANPIVDYHQHPNHDQIFNHQPSTIATSNSFQPIYQQTFVSSPSQHNANYDNSAQYFNPLAVSEFPVTSTSALYGQSALFETGASGLQPNEFESLLIGDEHGMGSSNGLAEQPIYEPISAPNSTYSASTSSPWSAHDSYTSDSTGALSQDDILEEIQRECAEIEERHSSASPPERAPKLKKSSSSRQKQKSRAARAPVDPYAMKPSSSKISKQHSLSPCSSLADGGDKKKELNRIAATKYREKKRMERESNKSVLKTLEERNTELRTECTSMESEIKYLKGLIKEIESRTARR